MWIEAEGPHRKLLNGSKIETLYVSYKSSGVWAVCASIGDRDFTVKSTRSEREAQDWCDALEKRLS